MKRYVIERDIPGVGAMSNNELSGASATSNNALAQLGSRVQWSHSYVAGDKTFCIYFAESVADINEHAKISGFPANVITEVATTIDPSTAR